jgi:two-component system, NtrC family, sensor histidine kinase AtoS
MDRVGKILDMRNIHVSYGALKALDGIDFDLYGGEIHGLIGEHRAGKSTLVKVLGGDLRIDEGSITIMGDCVDASSLKSAPSDRIGIVYQDLTIVPHLNAVENIYLGRMVRRPFHAIDHGQMRSRALELFDYLGCNIDLRVPVYKLKRVQQHIVEFAKALAFDPRVLILDELSNKLTPEEMEIVYRVIFDLRDKGCGIVYISHNIDEILKLADRVTILKGGHRRLTAETDQLDKLRLFELTYSVSLDEQQEFRVDAPLVRLKRYLQNVIQFLPVGVFLLDDSGDMRLYNLAANEICSLGAEDTIQRPFFDILDTLSEDGAAVSAFRKSFSERAPFGCDELRTKSGKTLRVHGELIHDQKGDRMGTLVVIEDVSLDRYVSDYVLEKAKMTTLAQLAVGVAHEINNPLFVIQNYLEVIRGKNEDPEVEDRIAKIEREVGRIVEIVSSLLSFSRTKPLSASAVNLREVVETASILLHHELREKSISIEIDAPDRSVCAICDENKLTQILLNLINNAIDAVLNGGRIIVSVRRSEGDMACLSVIDNGCGIPEDIANKIFDPFFTTKLSKKNTGLGLSICKHIVEEHEGRISFESAPGRGTVFKILLPGARAQPEAAERGPQPRPAGRGAPALS